MRTVLALVLLLVFVSPAFAAGNLEVNSSSLAPAYINTRNLTNMLSLNFNATTEDIRLVSINVTISGNATIGNVSSVSVLNSTGAVLAANSTNLTGTKFIIFIPNGINVSTLNITTLTVAVNLSASAASGSNLSVRINDLNEFGVNTTATTISSSAGASNSTESIIQDVHVSTSIIPRIVDTYVTNQTFIYTFLPTGTNSIQNFSLSIPSGFTLVNLSSVEVGGSNLSAGFYTNTTLSNQLNITLTSTSTTSTVKLFFNANTSSPAVGFFTSTVTGSNLTGVATDAMSNQTNVTAKVLLNVTNIGAIKTVAIVNNSDYWEFNFTINVPSTVSWMVQFKMTNWTSTESYSIALSNQTTSFATLRNSSDFNTTGKFNVTNEYNITQGLQYTNVSGVINLFLRMIIPSNTGISQSWFTTYGMVFSASA